MMVMKYFQRGMSIGALIVGVLCALLLAALIMAAICYLLYYAFSVQPEEMEGERMPKDEQEPTREKQMATQRGILAECAQITRRACEELIRLIDAGEFAAGRTDDQFGWLDSLRSRRQLIIGTILTLDGQRSDRVGMSARDEGDRANRIGRYRD